MGGLQQTNLLFQREFSGPLCNKRHNYNGVYLSFLIFQERQ